MTAVDLSQLTAPDVIEALDFETILAERKAFFISLYPAAQQAEIASLLELESEPVVKLLQSAAYRELGLRARYNDEARAVMLAFSTGADLDHIGVTYYHEARLLITPADPAANPPVVAVYEDDEAYRDRLNLKPESWSTAGPGDAYEFHARSASGIVKDATAVSQSPGIVLVTVLSREGNGIPTQALLDTVSAALNTDQVIPLNDEVHVQAAELVNYALVADLIVLPGSAGQVAALEAKTALDAYAAASHKLGKSIILTDIIAAAKRTGVQDLALNLQANIAISKQQAAWCTSVVVNIAGIAP